MQTELRVYAINPDEIPEEQSELFQDLLTIDDELWMLESERQGFVWTTQEFQSAFNFDEISDQWYIRFIEVKIN